MPQSFFNLLHQAPDRDDHDAFLASLTAEEEATLHAEAEPLYLAIMDALQTHCAEHDISHGACIHAATVLVYVLERQLDEDTADA